MNRTSRDIEPIFHFVWFGNTFVDFGLFAIASALRHNPGSRAILWHGAELQVDQNLARLCQEGLELRTIVPESLIAQAKQAGASFDVARLARIYDKLNAPAARSNLVRLLALYVHGGIYLDTDTLTLKSFDALRKSGAFCGLEHVLWPQGRGRIRLGAITLSGLRSLCASVSWGYSLHKALLRFYSEAANNAVLGFSAHHPFLDRTLTQASQVPEAEWTRRFRLGTHLLQQGLKDQTFDPSTETPVTQLSPEFFYPLGPVISRHYFRPTENVEAKTIQLIDKETVVIHWYASVSELKGRDSAHIRASRTQEPYAFLCANYLDLFES